MLRRHGGDDGKALRAYPPRFGLAIGAQSAPALEVRRRRASGAGGENDGGHLAGLDQRRILQGAGRACRWRGDWPGGQPFGALLTVVQAQQLRIALLQLAHGFGGKAGRHERGPPGQQGRAQTHHEQVAVVAGVQHVLAGGQCFGHALRVGKEARGLHGALRAEGQCFIRSVGAQREGGWVHLALPGCVAERA